MKTYTPGHVWTTTVHIPLATDYAPVFRLGASYEAGIGPEGIANARLIAAAPELLAALTDADSLLSALASGYAIDIAADTRVLSIRRACRAAIAKATEPN